jgi:hypothetical protein
MGALWVKLRLFLCLQALCHGNVRECKCNLSFLHVTLGGVSCPLHKWDYAHWLGGLIGLMVYSRDHQRNLSYSWRCG